MTNNARAQKRWQLIASLRVYDNNSGNVVGHLFDVTTEGVRLISEQPFLTDREYTFHMQTDDETADTQRIELNARSIWSKEDISPTFFDTGFQLIDVSSETKAYLSHLIDELKATQS